MKVFMASVILEVFNKFVERLKIPGEYCFIRELDYSSGASPDYSNVTLQYLYMLRYLCAYMCEYYDAYSKILSSNFIRNQLNVFSLGCGCGVDFYALYFVARDKELPPGVFSYSGIDIVQWERLCDIESVGSRILIEDFLAWYSLDRRDYNVLFFPKSIGEFSEEQFNEILNILQQSTFEQRQIVMVNSLRKERAEVDSLRTWKLVDILRTSHGYRVCNQRNTRVGFGNEAIRSIFCGLFDYPSHVSQNLAALINWRDCGGRDNRFCSVDCERQIKKQPMLKCGYLMYDIVYLEI